MAKSTVYGASKYARISLSGLDDYLAKVAEAGRNIDAVVKDALEEYGGEILSEMQQLVPRDTGNLANHLTMTNGSIGNTHYVDIGLDMSDRESVLYGIYQEWGTASMPAHPYIRPAFDHHKRTIYKSIKAYLKKEGLL